jgi:hypothetical protein
MPSPASTAKTGNVIVSVWPRCLPMEGSDGAPESRFDPGSKHLNRFHRESYRLGRGEVADASSLQQRLLTKGRRTSRWRPIRPNGRPRAKEIGHRVPLESDPSIRWQVMRPDRCACGGGRDRAITGRHRARAPAAHPPRADGRWGGAAWNRGWNSTMHILMLLRTWVSIRRATRHVARWIRA